MPYSLSVTEGSSYNLSASDTSSNLSLSLTGPAGPSGPAGPAGTGGGDHGTLTGLGDDDHTQYFNQTRGDARYITINGNAGTPSAIVLTNATGNASALSVNFAVTSLYANDAGMAGGVARSGIITALLSDPLPITSGGTGAASESTARTALKVPGSVTTGITGATAITNIVSITLANYNALTKDPTTLYVING